MSGGKTSFRKEVKHFSTDGKTVDYHHRVTISGFCSKCNAWYGQLGLEPTIDLYISHLLQVTAELKRVLRKDGIMFWNQGDSYWGSGKEKDPKYGKGRDNQPSFTKGTGYQAKCMLLQNYRLILKMIDEQGWILRNSIIWNKPNHMPTSVKDRFANGYEPVFMLVKSKKYWFDLDAVRMPYIEPINRWGGEWKRGQYKEKYKEIKSSGKSLARERNYRPDKSGKNPGDVWLIPTQPFPEAHFATFPEKLVTPMILAGCPQEICKKCGKARVRITKPTKEYAKHLGTWTEDTDKSKKLRDEIGFQAHTKKKALTADYQTIGWTDCGCNAGWTPGILLDPFVGAGAVLRVAKNLGYAAIGIDIKKEYCDMSIKGIKNITPSLPLTD